jgi:hypothetical protein
MEKFETGYTAKKIIETFADAYIDMDDVVRWRSNESSFS